MAKYLSKLSKSTRSNLYTVTAILAAYIIFTVLIATGNMSNLLQGLLIQIFYYAILAISLNLTVGILGELSLGHAGFMCIGAFTSAFFSKCTVDIITITWIRFTIALIIGAISAAIFGAFIGFVVLRLRGDYLAIVTLAFGEIIKNVINVLYIGIDQSGFKFSVKDSVSLNLGEGGQAIMNGPQGIFGTPNDTNLTICVFLLILFYIIISNLVNSRSGRAIMAIRDNRIAAESIGINITKFKLLAFTISAAMAGVAGTLFSHNITILDSKKFGYNQSIMILVFVVLGGIGNIRGSIIAAAILTLLPEYLRFLENYRMLIYAVVLIIIMIINWNPTCIAWRKKYSIRNLLSAINKKKEA